MSHTLLLKDIAGVSAFCTHAGFYEDSLPEISGITAEKIFIPCQTHSARVASPGEPLDNCDALVTDRPGVLLAIRTADCLPLLMADPIAGVIAAVHCGWRGAAAGIAANALARMVQLGADPRRIVAAAGPHICPHCFEVGDEVAAQFPKEAILQGYAKPHISLLDAVRLQLPGITVTEAPACSMESPTYHSVRRQGRAMPRRTLTAIYLR